MVRKRKIHRQTVMQSEVDDYSEFYCATSVKSERTVPSSFLARRCVCARTEFSKGLSDEIFVLSNSLDLGQKKNRRWLQKF